MVFMDRSQELRRGAAYAPVVIVKLVIQQQDGCRGRRIRKLVFIRTDIYARALGSHLAVEAVR